MDAFHFQNDLLHVEGVPLDRLAAEVGTPFYVYSRGALEANFRAYADALAGVPHLVCFAMKANPNLAVLATFARLGGGFDIVTGGELYRALQAGAQPRRIVYSGVGKSDDEIAYALRTGILMFNVESVEELDAIDRAAARLGTKAPIAIRVNPDVDPQTHPYISTGMKKSKFGVNITQAREAYARALSLPNLEVVGLDCHIGSQLTKLDPFLDSLDRVLPLIDELRGQGAPIRYLDFGGGLGITYRDETPPAPAEYGRAVAERVRGRDLTLIAEPGRNLVGNAGALVTRVLYNKAGEVKHFVIVDAGMNDLMRPSLYDAYHRIEPVLRRPDAAQRTVDVVGPICESGDFLAHDRDLRVLEQGELLAVLSAGAYGFAMSSQYNGRPRVPEVLVTGDRWDVVRARETYADLVRGETIPPALREGVRIPFTKMHGTGNDFVVVDARALPIRDYGAVARQVCDRRFGIGADQMLLVQDSPDDSAQYRMGIYNADGSEVEMCGNGIRCFAKYLIDHGLAGAGEIPVQTDGGLIIPSAEANGLFRVDMGEPILEGERIPTTFTGRVVDVPLQVLDRTFQVTCVSMGNPHCVIFVDDVETFPVATYGPATETHPAFPRRVNTEYIQVLDRGRLKMRVWERGAGETMACGTGASAALVAAVLNDRADRKADLLLRGGTLTIEWDAQTNHVFMTGPAVTVFEGAIELADNS